MKTLVLLHPFTPESIGLTFDDVIHSHSKPHIDALKRIQDNSLFVNIDYFSKSFFYKQIKIEGILKRFFPISIFKKKLRKQFSQSHFSWVKKNSPDLIIINTSGHGGKYVFELVKLLTKYKKPYICMIGGMNMSYVGDAYNYYKNANHILVHTEAQKKAILTNTEFSSFDIRVLPLGIDTSVFIPKIESNKIEGKLLFVGRINRIKQIEIAIEALNFLRMNNFENAQLSIIGPVSDEAYFEELKNQIKKLGLEEFVTFLGSIHQSKLVEYYQKNDLLLLPSVSESFGMVMIESMSCETPVAALIGSGGPDEIVENNSNGILVSYENYFESIFKLLNDNDKYVKVKRNARKTVIEKYSIEETTRVLKDSINFALK